MRFLPFEYAAANQKLRQNSDLIWQLSLLGLLITVVHPFSCIIISQKPNPGNVIVTHRRDIFSLLTQIAFSERILVNFAERDTLIQLQAITRQ